MDPLEEEQLPSENEDSDIEVGSNIGLQAAIKLSAVRYYSACIWCAWCFRCQSYLLMYLPLSCAKFTHRVNIDTIFVKGGTENIRHCKIQKGSIEDEIGKTGELSKG